MCGFRTLASPLSHIRRLRHSTHRWRDGAMLGLLLPSRVFQERGHRVMVRVGVTILGTRSFT